MRTKRTDKNLQISSLDKMAIEEKMRVLDRAGTVLLIRALIHEENRVFSVFCQKQSMVESLEFIKDLGELNNDEKITDYLALYLEHRKSFGKKPEESMEVYLQKKQETLEKNLSENLFTGDSARRQKNSFENRSTYFNAGHQHMMKQYLAEFSDKKIQDIFDKFIGNRAEKMINLTGKPGGITNQSCWDLFTCNDKTLKIALLYNARDQIELMLADNVPSLFCDEYADKIIVSNASLFQDSKPKGKAEKTSFCCSIL